MRCYQTAIGAATSGESGPSAPGAPTIGPSLVAPPCALACGALPIAKLPFAPYSGRGECSHEQRTHSRSALCDSRGTFPPGGSAADATLDRSSVHRNLEYYRWQNPHKEQTARATETDLKRTRSISWQTAGRSASQETTDLRCAQRCVLTSVMTSCSLNSCWKPLQSRLKRSVKHKPFLKKHLLECLGFL